MANEDVRFDLAPVDLDTLAGDEASFSSDARKRLARNVITRGDLLEQVIDRERSAANDFVFSCVYLARNFGRFRSPTDRNSPTL